MAELQTGAVFYSDAFRLDDDPEVLLRLRFKPNPGGLDDDCFDVHVTAPEFDFSHSVLTYGGDGLNAFFQGLLKDWQGWSGVRRWETIEPGLCIDAVHMGNVVELTFTLRRYHHRSAGWELRLPIFIAPGESLKRVAAEVAALF